MHYAMPVYTSRLSAISAASRHLCQMFQVVRARPQREAGFLRWYLVKVVVVGPQVPELVCLIRWGSWQDWMQRSCQDSHLGAEGCNWKSQCGLLTTVSIRRSSVHSCRLRSKVIKLMPKLSQRKNMQSSDCAVYREAYTALQKRSLVLTT